MKIKITIDDLKNELLDSIEKEKQCKQELIDLINKESCSPYEIFGKLDDAYVFRNFYAFLCNELLKEIDVEGLSIKEINNRFSKYLKSQVRDKLLKSDITNTQSYRLSHIFIHNRTAMSIFYSNYKKYKVINDNEVDY
ncbi:hypothetical protein KY334_02610 [Candidatus Woesearchaeota archaeon]|nr:hypothetical protein [Candidatus Woesearchaeota archaeon]